MQHTWWSTKILCLGKTGLIDCLAFSKLICFQQQLISNGKLGKQHLFGCARNQYDHIFLILIFTAIKCRECGNWIAEPQEFGYSAWTRKYDQYLGTLPHCDWETGWGTPRRWHTMIHDPRLWVFCNQGCKNAFLGDDELYGSGPED